MNGVTRQVRVGDVALHALDGEVAGERTTAAVLDHVATAMNRGGFTDDGVLDGFATCLKGIDHNGSAVVGGAFFIRGQQEGDGTGMVRVLGDELFDRHHKGSQRAFHVGSATAIEFAVAFRGLEGGRCPGVEVAGRHHVRVAGQHHEWRGGAASRPEIAGAVAVDTFEDKAEWLEPLGDEFEATGIFRGNRSPRNEGFGKLTDGFAHGSVSISRD